jgi:hypothetical protein
MAKEEADEEAKEAGRVNNGDGSGGDGVGGDGSGGGGSGGGGSGGDGEDGEEGEGEGDELADEGVAASPARSPTLGSVASSAARRTAAAMRQALTLAASASMGAAGADSRYGGGGFLEEVKVSIVPSADLVAITHPPGDPAAGIPQLLDLSGRDPSGRDPSGRDPSGADLPVEDPLQDPLRDPLRDPLLSSTSSSPPAPSSDPFSDPAPFSDPFSPVDLLKFRAEGRVARTLAARVGSPMGARPTSTSESHKPRVVTPTS